MCGKNVSDCSCSASCKQSGNCCSDYETINCDLIKEKSFRISRELCQRNLNCDMCDDIERVGAHPKCNQCATGFYLSEGLCVEKCLHGTTSNFTCLQKKESR